MASDVEIVNRALIYLGAQTIISLGDNTQTAKLSNQIYSQVLDDVLSSHPWKCARKRASLAELATPPAFGYQHQYLIPSDFLWLLELAGGRSLERRDIAYVREGANILTDEGPPLHIIYISRVIDPNILSSYVREVLSWRLALELAEAITGSSGKKSDISSLYMNALRQAKYRDSLEKSLNKLEAETFVDAHGTLDDPQLLRGIDIP